MLELLNGIIPNVMNKPDELWLAVQQTVYMFVTAGIIAFALGLFFGTVLAVTSPRALLESPRAYAFLSGTVNIFRSIPFVILLAALIPVSRFITGTAIGTVGAMVPLVVGTVPFFSRQVESALSSVDHGLIEAAKSMGSSDVGIIFRVYL